jgi:peptidyl-prolyl cis-trans isomerase D
MAIASMRAVATLPFIFQFPAINFFMGMNVLSPVAPGNPAVYSFGDFIGKKEFSMLNAMRDGAHSRIIKFVLFSFLVMATLGMVLMDVGGFFRNGGVGNNSVARAGKDNISSVTFDRAVQRTLQQQGIAPREAYQYGLVDQILKNEISTRLMTRAAADMGLYVGDRDVASQINSLIEPLTKQQPGLSRKDILHRVLQAQGMGEQELVGSLRQSMMNSLLQGTVQAGAMIPSRQEALALYAHRNETRTVEGFILPDSGIKTVEDAPDQVLTALYEAAKGTKYLIPETRSFTIATLSESNVKAGPVPDEALKKEYDRSVAAYTLPERRVIQQAVLKDEESAKKVADSVRGGQPLKDAAKTAYLGEQTFEQAGLVKEIADATFSAEVNKVAGPVKTPLGWHVLVVTKILPAEVKPFESVKEDIRKELSQTQMVDQLSNTANSIDDRLAGGEALEDVARDMGMALEKIESVRDDGSTGDKHEALKSYAKDRDYILKSVFEMNEGESAPVMELGDGRYAAIRLDKINERTFRPFADVKDELKKEWAGDQKTSLNRSRAQQAQQDAANGKKLDDLAAAYGVKLETFSELKRTGKPPEKIGAGGIQMLFAASEGDAVAAPVPGGFLVGRVKSVTLPDPAKVTDKDLQEIEAGIQRDLKEEMVLVYMQYLEDKYGVKINRRLLDSLYGPESGNPG